MPETEPVQRNPAPLLQNKPGETCRTRRFISNASAGRKPEVEVAMLNEGILINDAKTRIKSEILKQLWTAPYLTPDNLERSVFYGLTGGTREDVDWEVEDNQAGYYAWLKSFDGLVGELVQEGFIRIETGNGRHLLVAAQPGVEFEPTQVDLG
jgi:hypothetical protein